MICKVVQHLIFRVEAPVLKINIQAADGTAGTRLRESCFQHYKEMRFARGSRTEHGNTWKRILLFEFNEYLLNSVFLGCRPVPGPNAHLSLHIELEGKAEHRACAFSMQAEMSCP